MTYRSWLSPFCRGYLDFRYVRVKRAVLLLACLMLALAVAPAAYAETLTLTNVTRSSLNSNFVVADYWALSVSGALANVSVQIQWTNDTGGSSSTYTAGYTDTNGNFYSSSIVISGNIGRWTGQGIVGGVSTGDPFGTEIIAEPTSLTILSSPSGASCVLSDPQPYGFVGQNFTWQVKTLIYGVYNIPMTSRVSASGVSGYFDGSVSLGFLVSFSDPAEPYGACTTYPFTGIHFATTYYMGIGGFYGSAVRTNSWTQSSTSPHAGELKNFDDVDIVF